MFKFKYIKDYNPHISGYEMGFGQFVIIQEDEDAIRQRNGADGESLKTAFLTDETEIEQSRLAWLKNLWTKTTNAGGDKEAGGFFRNGLYTVFESVGTEGGINFTSRLSALNLTISDVELIGHTHPLPFSFNQFLPSKFTDGTGDFAYTERTGKTNYVYAGDQIISKLVKYGEKAVIAGLYKTDGTKYNLYELFNQFGVRGEGALAPLTPDDFADAGLVRSVISDLSLLKGQGKGEQDEVVPPKEEIYLMDANQNLYNLEDVSIGVDKATPNDGSVHIPDPLIIRKDGSVIQEGAKVLIMFPQGRRNPVVICSLFSLGSQQFQANNMRVHKSTLKREVAVRAGQTWRAEKIDDHNGDHLETYHNCSYNIGVSGEKASASIKSDDYCLTEGKKTHDVLGETVEIGGNNIPVKDGQALDFLKNKANEVNVFAKKVFLGHSNNRTKDPIQLDIATQVDNPKLQNSVMGITIKRLLEILIDLLLSAQYMGNGVVVKISEPDKQRIITQVKNKLPKILSNVVYLLKEPNQMQ